MTISKKLLIVGLLALGMHHGTQAYTNEVSGEASQILDFAQTLQQVNNKDALKVAQWLKLQVSNTSYTYIVQDCDILTIANVINNPDLTIPSKISALSKIMVIQKRETIKDICRVTVGTTAIVLYIGMICALPWKKTYKGGAPRNNGYNHFW